MTRYLNGAMARYLFTQRRIVFVNFVEWSWDLSWLYLSYIGVWAFQISGLRHSHSATRNLRVFSGHNCLHNGSYTPNWSIQCGQRRSDQTSTAVIPYINPPPSWDRVGPHSPERSNSEALTIVLLTSFYSHVNTQLSSGIRVELFSTYEIRGWLPIPELISTGAKGHHQWTLPLEISRSNFLTQRQFHWLVNTYDHISRHSSHIWLHSHFGCEWVLNSYRPVHDCLRSQV